MLGRKRDDEPQRTGLTLLDVVERLAYRVDELTHSVTELSARVSALEAKHAGLSMGVAKNKANNDNLSEALAEVVQAVEKHNAEVKELLLAVLDRLDKLVEAEE